MVISNLNVLRGSFIMFYIGYVKRKIKLLLVMPCLYNVCSKGIFIPSLLQMHKLCSWMGVKQFYFLKCITSAATLQHRIKWNYIRIHKGTWDCQQWWPWLLCLDCTVFNFFSSWKQRKLHLLMFWSSLINLISVIVFWCC